MVSKIFVCSCMFQQFKNQLDFCHSLNGIALWTIVVLRDSVGGVFGAIEGRVGES